MKKLLIGLLLLCMVSSYGCSGLIAKGPMAATIEYNAALAAQQLATPPSVAESPAVLIGNAGIFNQYYEASTVNLFVYLFSSKQILVTPAYYRWLVDTAATSQEVVARLARFDEVTILSLVKSEATWLIQVKKAKNGEK